MVEWLERRDCNRYDLGSKPTHAILLCPLERHFSVLTFSHFSINTVKNQNIKFVCISASVAFLRVRRINIEIKKLVNK